MIQILPIVFDSHLPKWLICYWNPNWRFHFKTKKVWKQSYWISIINDLIHETTWKYLIWTYQRSATCWFQHTMKNVMISKKRRGVEKKKPTDSCFKEKTERVYFLELKNTYLWFLLLHGELSKRKMIKKDTTTSIKHKSIISSVKMWWTDPFGDQI